jgi:hypothetical protein
VLIPNKVQQLLSDYASIFTVHTELPPQRACDHSIPLLEGVAPVSVEPYRFASTMKDEIEKQVQEMLDNGIIQKSSSPFSSYMLLVKKNDNTWCFCVDYRH